MTHLSLWDNKLSGTPPFAHVASFSSTSLPLAEKDLPFALAGEIPRELCQCTKLTWLCLDTNQLAGTFRQNHCLQRWYTSLPLALRTPSFALAGPIPTEFGDLINLTHLGSNDLTGTPRLLILPGLVVPESTTCFNQKRPLCVGRVDPHRIWQAHQHDAPLPLWQPIERYAPVRSFYLFGSTRVYHLL